MATFSDMSLLSEIQKSLEALGFTKPTEIQSKVIPLLIKNWHQDVHAQAQTGTGKTLAFGIPLIQSIDISKKVVQGLVIAPTRELVLQIYESLRDIAREMDINIEALYGGMPIERQIARIKHGAQIVIGTPGRLNDHLRRKSLSLYTLKILVLDEADIMLDMGFKEEIDSILRQVPKDRAIWLFSATVRSGIMQLIKSHMQNVVSVKAMPEKSLATKQVKQYFCVVPMGKRVNVLARFIEAAPEFYGIVFCKTKILTSEVTEQLISRGFKANCLHGDMKQSLRNQVIKGFKNKDFTILVATDVAARGIDVADLTHVINFSMPDEMDTYVHRIGRTGRAGREGIAIIFVSPSQIRQVKQLERVTHIPLHEIPIPPKDAIVNAKLSAISDFIEQTKKPDQKFSSVHPILKELIKSFSFEEVQNAFAVALEDKFFKSIQEDLNGISAAIISVPQEICLELGGESGLNEQEVREYLYRTCKLLPQEVSKVRVLRKRTFISIPENRLSDCLSQMRASPIAARYHKIYLVEDAYQQKKKKRRFQERRFFKKRGKLK